MRGTFALVAVSLVGCATAESDSYSYVQIIDDDQMLLDEETISKSSLVSSIQNDRAAGEKVFVCAASGTSPFLAAELLKSIAELGDYEIIFGAGEECDSLWPKKIIEGPNGLVAVTLENENAGQ